MAVSTVLRVLTSLGSRVSPTDGQRGAQQCLAVAPASCGCKGPAAAAKLLCMLRPAPAAFANNCGALQVLMHQAHILQRTTSQVQHSS